GGAFDISHAPNWPGTQNKYSVVNRYTFARLDAPTFFLTYGETQLYLAEAAQNGWVTGTPAATYYNAGVTGSMAMLGSQLGAGPSPASITAYLAANPYNAVTGLKQINYQYWVTSFMDENESFANWRRSGYPTLTPVNYTGNATGGTIPRRFTYPQGEASTNGTNYGAAVQGLANGDKMTSRVWWDK
ncbi:MAG: SusD/RagB family nutrient-binding outer membrane lipoprotein, partial [Bacteroidota bacterium]|nr:SusD/RagB family nutrient-binding outer membrane lipoprotein [Bacteroidota bacterium]